MTLAEYLEDYASPETKKIGYDMIERELQKVPRLENRQKAAENIEYIKNSDRRDFRF